MMLQKLHREKTTVTHITPVDVFLSGTIGVCKKHTCGPVHLHYMHWNLCVHLKKVKYIWDCMRVNKRWENLHFWLEYPFNEPDVMQRPEIYSRQNIRACVELMMSDIELKHTILTFWKSHFCNSSSFNCVFGAFRVFSPSKYWYIIIY